MKPAQCVLGVGDANNGVECGMCSDLLIGITEQCFDNSVSFDNGVLITVSFG